MRTPISLSAMAQEFVIGKKTAWNVVEEVSKAISNLSKEFIPIPSKETWLKNRSEFAQLVFPSCIGCMDGKHFTIKVR
jgi:hypothetical protein